MDELEISGKRYISTRRAGKENKYHSDYIGQLIRGGKVDGQKVGRSWYVEEESLKKYLNAESGAPVKIAPVKSAPVIKAVIAKPTPVEVESVIEEVAPAVEVEAAEEVEIETEIPKEEIQEVVEEKNIVSEVIEEEETPIVIHRPVQIKKEIPAIKARPSLRYIADDGPLYPRVERTPQIKIRVQEPTEAIEVETPYVDEEPVTIIARPVKKINATTIAMRGGMILAAGLIAVGIAAGLSALVVSNTTVNDQTATVNYGVSIPK